MSEWLLKDDSSIQTNGTTITSDPAIRNKWSESRAVRLRIAVPPCHSAADHREYEQEAKQHDALCRGDREMELTEGGRIDFVGHHGGRVRRATVGEHVD